MPNKKRKTTASSSRARRQGRLAEPGESHGDVTQSPKGATGCELGVPPRSVEGRNGGTLTPYPPGSNGGMHRGPDKGIRRNVVRAIFMGALADEGVSIENLRRRRKHSKGMTL